MLTSLYQSKDGDDYTYNFSVSSKNVVNTGNNVYQYDFPQGGVQLKNKYLCLNSSIILNTYPNISSTLSNTNFGYTINGAIGARFSTNISGASGPPTITIVTALSSTSYLIDAGIGFLLPNYILTFVGITTTTPIIVVSATLTTPAVNYYTVVINQPVTILTSTNGSSYIVGNQMIVSGYVPTLGVSQQYVPQTKMFLQDTNFLSGSTATLSGFNNWITAVSPFSPTTTSNNYNQTYIITLANSIPSSALITSYNTVSVETRYFFPITLTGGYYTITDLNTALQNAMYANGHVYYNLLTTSGTKASGNINESLFYPLGLTYNIPQYSFGCNGYGVPTFGGGTTLPKSLETLFGTGALMTNTYMTNGFFNATQITLNTNTTAYAYNWTSTKVAGNYIWASCNGATLGFPSPPTQSYWYAVVNSTANNVNSLSQTNYYPAGTYTVSFAIADSSGVSINRAYNCFINDAVVGDSYSSTSITFPSVANTWTTNTVTITVPAGRCGVSLVFTFLDNVNALTFGITNITVTSSSNTLLGNNWYNGFPTTGTNSVQLYPNIYQNSGDNTYSLGSYLCRNRLPNLSMTNTTTTFMSPTFSSGGIPYYGLGMNPFYGFIIRVNIIKNPMAAQTDIMDSIPLIYGFGQQNIYIGNPLNDIEIYNGKYNSMTIQICDQNGNSLALLDSNVVLSFIIRNRNLHEVRDV